MITFFIGLALLPGMFYMYVCMSYILSAHIGFNLPWDISYIVSGVLTAAYAAAILIYGSKQNKVKKLA